MVQHECDLAGLTGTLHPKAETVAGVSAGSGNAVTWSGKDRTKGTHTTELAVVPAAARAPAEAADRAYPSDPGRKSCVTASA
jgi:hypothetical protein